MQTAKSLGEKRRARKERFFQDFGDAVSEVAQLLIVNIDHVGSRQLQKTRRALRGHATIVVGKNTVMRKVLREAAETRASLASLVPLVRGNVALVFVTPGASLQRVKELLTQEFVPASARPNDTAQSDVVIPAGSTGLDPGQTSFFQALNISTKISKGAIEIITDQKVLRQGEKISLSIVALLNRLDIKPFEYRIVPERVWDDGEVYSAEVLDVTEDDLRRSFVRALQPMAALQLAIQYVGCSANAATELTDCDRGCTAIRRNCRCR